MNCKFRVKRLIVIILHRIFLERKIRENYRFRCEGKIKDEWYWADLLCSNYGVFTVEINGDLYGYFD